MKMYPLVVSNWDHEEAAALQRVVSSGRFTMGEEVEDFEKQFAAKVGSKFAVMVNSGSSANLLMIAALCEIGALHAGDEVIVPAVSWSTTYFPLHQYGLKIVLCDVDPNTFCIDPVKVADLITNRTAAILAVHLLGNPCDMSKLAGLCTDESIILLEDNCEGFGAKWGEAWCGTCGRVGTFSTYFSHHLNTIEGGVVVTDNYIIYNALRSMRSHGWSRSEPGYTGSFEDSFKFIHTGYNLRPQEFNAALGLAQLKKADHNLLIRTENARDFADRFDGDARLRIQKQTPGGKSSWFGFGVVLNIPRVGVIRALKQYGIECRPIIAGNIARHPVAEKLNMCYDELPVADELHDDGLFIGNDERCLQGQFDLVSTALHGVGVLKRA